MARPRKTEEGPVGIPCRVIIPNLWTSLGKSYQGDEVMLPAEEADRLDAEDKIKIVRTAR